MRTKLLLSTLSLFFLINTSYGQGFVFRVLASKGQNSVKKGENGETVALKTGATLMSGDELIAASGAYIGLMHKTGRTIEVRNPGITKISDLETKLSSSKSSVSSKYASFVMNKMNEDDSDVNQNYRSNMKTTGAVTRAAPSGSALSLMLPNSVNVLNAEATVQWSSVSEQVENPTYIVTIANIFEEEIYTTETSKTNLSINFDDENLASERLVIINVKVKDNEGLVSGDVGITRMSDDDAVTINDDLNMLRSEVPLDDSPLNHLIYASFYEENNLILDAMTEYQKAISLSPDVKEFEIMYSDFLIKNNLK